MTNRSLQSATLSADGSPAVSGITERRRNLSAASRNQTSAQPAATSAVDLLLAELIGYVQQLSRISQNMAATMADLEPSLAYPQVYLPASESQLREQVLAIEPQLAATCEKWGEHRSRASHAQVRRITSLITQARQMCEALRPPKNEPAEMVDPLANRQSMQRDYQAPTIVVRPHDVLADLTGGAR